MKIQSVTISENEDGADVEILLDDAPNADDAHEYLAFSVTVQYDKAEIPSLEQIKELAFAKARSICADQANIAKMLQDDYR